MAHETASVVLPSGIMTVMDLRQVERELIAVEDFSLQSAIRTAGHQPSLPKTSHNLEELAKQNGFNLLQSKDRQQLAKLIQGLQLTAPVIHMSLATEPSRAFLSKIISWFRQQIHPLVLLQVGLQPNIAAGCTLRTANKFFDFSLRQYFMGKRQLLIDKLVEDKS